MKRIEFGTDGVRGTAGQWPMNLEGALCIGKGIGHYLKKRKNRPCVIAGRDTRASSDMLFAAASAGLLAYGVDVSDVGVVTTPGVAYLAKKNQADMGIVISASHNPWTENGIKLIDSYGFKLEDESEKTIEDHVDNLGDLNVDIEEFGYITHNVAWIDEYIRHLISPFEENSLRMKVVLDCANGATSFIAPRCFELLGCDVTVLHNTPTGTNINVNSGSEVIRSGRGDLASAVVQQGARFGVAFDGDGDRAIFVDENGNLIDGDHILYIFAKYLKALGQLPQDTIVTTEMANSGLDRSLLEVGIHTVRTKVGDKYVLREILSGGYVLGGEQSGHIILFDDSHTTGDGIYTALFLANICTQTRAKSLRVLCGGFHKWPQVIASDRVNAKPQLEQLDAFALELGDISRSLGVDAVVIARYSGTEPLIRVMIEADPEHPTAEIAGFAVRLCQAVQLATGGPSGAAEVKDCVSGKLIDIRELCRLQKDYNGPRKLDTEKARNKIEYRP